MRLYSIKRVPLKKRRKLATLQVKPKNIYTLKTRNGLKRLLDVLHPEDAGLIQLRPTPEALGQRAKPLVDVEKRAKVLLARHNVGGVVEPLAVLAAVEDLDIPVVGTAPALDKQVGVEILRSHAAVDTHGALLALGSVLDDPEPVQMRQLGVLAVALVLRVVLELQ